MGIERRTTTTIIQEAVLKQSHTKISLQQSQRLKTALVGQGRFNRRKQRTDHVREADLRFDYPFT